MKNLKVQPQALSCFWRHRKEKLKFSLFRVRKLFYIALQGVTENVKGKLFNSEICNTQRGLRNERIRRNTLLSNELILNPYSTAPPQSLKISSKNRHGQHTSYHMLEKVKFILVFEIILFFSKILPKQCLIKS